MDTDGILNSKVGATAQEMIQQQIQQPSCCHIRPTHTFKGLAALFTVQLSDISKSNTLIFFKQMQYFLGAEQQTDFVLPVFSTQLRRLDFLSDCVLKTTNAEGGTEGWVRLWAAVKARK